MRRAMLISALLLTRASMSLAAEAAVPHAEPAAAAVPVPTFVAGTAPSLRPADAPSLAAVAKDARWFQKALTGVEAPYPSSLTFLEDQGNWYTPFTQPGMTGAYDLRRWHR